MTAPEPVRPGTAEALARVMHFQAVEHVQPEELDSVARWLIGHVTDPREVAQHIADELDQLWSLLTDDFDDDQLDELSDADWERHSFSTYAQEVEHRRALTLTRLVAAIEGHIWLARYTHAEQARAMAGAA